MPTSLPSDMAPSPLADMAPSPLADMAPSQLADTSGVPHTGVPTSPRADTSEPRVTAPSQAADRASPPVEAQSRAGDRRYFCPAPRGLETALADELERLAARQITTTGGGVLCSGPLALGYRINLRSRIASRVLMQVARGPVRNEQALYELARAQAWERLFSPQRTLRVDLNAIRSNWRSLNFATLRIKDAVCDRLRERTGTRPSIDTATPDVRVHGFIESGQATLYVDLSGEPLFKRGWRDGRDTKGEAPLKENLAAGLIGLSEWTPDQPLLDPFCGSGTIVIEAAQIAAGIAPGLRRRFAIEKLELHDPAVDAAERKSASRRTAAGSSDAQPRIPRPTIVGRDSDPRMIERARRNAARAGLDESQVRFEVADAATMQPPTGTASGPPSLGTASGPPSLDHAPTQPHAAPPSAQPTEQASAQQHSQTTWGCIICNPPYGERVSMPDETWRAFGARLRAGFGGWRALILTSDRTLPGHVGLRERRKTPLFNGPIECRLFEFRMRRR